jgi:hypothetical protein
MPAVKISARLKLDENIERTNWCPSISGWTSDSCFVGVASPAWVQQAATPSAFWFTAYEIGLFL